MYESEFALYVQAIEIIKNKEQEVLREAMNKDIFNAVIAALILQL